MDATIVYAKVDVTPNAKIDAKVDAKIDAIIDVNLDAKKMQMWMQNLKQKWVGK